MSANLGFSKAHISRFRLSLSRMWEFEEGQVPHSVEAAWHGEGKGAILESWMLILETLDEL